MNILHITSAKTWRGGERQIQYLIEGMNDKGHSNSLMSPKVSIIGYRSSEIVTSQLAFRTGLFGRFHNVFSLMSYCKSHKIDLIHGHDSHAHTLIWLAYRLGGLKTKSIITRRLINPIKNRSIPKYNYPKIERIVCISNAVRKVLIPSIKDIHRLVVIHSAVKISTEIDNHKSRKEDSKFVVGYVAAFTEEKDHATFLATAKHLISKYPQVSFRFLLVGDGPLIEQIKIESKRIEGDFVFTGFLEEVNQVYNDMDILLHTSKSEALGTSILDAMKYGLPVVGSKVGGIPEIIQNGINGFLCEIGDYDEMANAVYNLATNSELYTAFSKKGKELVLNFEVSTLVNMTHELYHEVLNR